jgi:hypothetical protein
MVAAQEESALNQLIPFDRFGPNAMVMKDVVDGRLYMQLTLPANAKVTPWNCICHPDRHYGRPHFTCLMFCRTKSLAQGKLPATIPVNLYRMYIHLGRPHARFKDWLLRKLVFPIGEWLAN